MRICVGTYKKDQPANALSLSSFHSSIQSEQLSSLWKLWTVENSCIFYLAQLFTLEILNIQINFA